MVAFGSSTLRFEARFAIMKRSMERHRPASDAKWSLWSPLSDQLPMISSFPRPNRVHIRWRIQGDPQPDRCRIFDHVVVLLDPAQRIRSPADTPRLACARYSGCRAVKDRRLDSRCPVSDQAGCHVGESKVSHHRFYVGLVACVDQVRSFGFVQRCSEVRVGDRQANAQLLT